MKTSLSVCAIAACLIALPACKNQANTNDTTTSARVLQTGSTAGCKVQGVWSLDSALADGKLDPNNASYKQLKVITGTHYTWVGQNGGQMPLATTNDTLAAYRTRGSGGGTYRVTDSTYIEHLDFFSDPSQIGRDVVIGCHMTGNRWEATFDWPVVEKGKARSIHVQEIWRRVE
jgi:hypothetical protein